jgi:hypothetical protein
LAGEDDEGAIIPCRHVIWLNRRHSQLSPLNLDFSNMSGASGSRIRKS